MKKKSINKNVKLALFVVIILLLTGLVFCTVAVANAPIQDDNCGSKKECVPNMMKVSLKSKFLMGLENMFTKPEFKK